MLVQPAVPVQITGPGSDMLDDIPIARYGDAQVLDVYATCCGLITIIYKIVIGLLCAPSLGTGTGSALRSERVRPEHGALCVG